MSHIRANCDTLQNTYAGWGVSALESCACNEILVPEAHEPAAEMPGSFMPENIPQPPASFVDNRLYAPGGSFQETTREEAFHHPELNPYTLVQDLVITMDRPLFSSSHGHAHGSEYTSGKWPYIEASHTVTEDASSSRVPCFLGGPCPGWPIIREEISQRAACAVREHIRQHHAALSQVPKSPNNTVFCPWQDGWNKVCNVELCDVFGGLAKHIATVHLRVYEVQCRRCGKSFSREDSLKRHLSKKRCPSMR